MQQYKLLGWNLDELAKYGLSKFLHGYLVEFPQIVESTGRKDMNGLDVVTVNFKETSIFKHHLNEHYSIIWFIYEKIA